MTHKEYADSLRLIAEFFESNIDIPLPHDGDTFRYFSASDKPTMGLVISALGSCTKHYGKGNSLFEAHKRFGTIEFQAICCRDAVCNRVVERVEDIPETVIPERTIPAYKKEIVRWECEPIITSANAEAQ